MFSSTRALLILAARRLRARAVCLALTQPPTHKPTTPRSDLELPADFVPAPQDGEVAAFERVPLAAVAAAVGAGPGGPDDFKDNCNLVIVDFLMRRGALAADAPGYLEVVRRLRSGDCS